MEAKPRDERSPIEGKSREELLALARACEWWHDIDLGGFITKGRVGRSPLIERAFDQVDFRGKKVLDIGCWDGLWSFEAEARGAADVYSVDYVSLRSYTEHPTYLIAHRLRGSKARHYPNLSVYDIERLGVADFDVVVYTGIYYHLLEPLRAFAALHSVMKAGGLMVVEGPVLDGVDRARADFYARTWFREDPTNWYVPSMACLREWLECTHFDVVRAFSLKGSLAGAAAPAGPPPSLASRLRRRVGAALRGPAPAPATPPGMADDEDRVSLVARSTCIGERLGTLRQIAALPALAAAPGITPEAAAGFAAAVALFRAARPWEHIGPERTILADVPMFSPQPVFLMVTGQRGGHCGLILFLRRPAVALHLQGSLLGALATWAPFLAAFLGPSGGAMEPQAVFNDGHAYPAPEVVHSVRRPAAYQLQALEACLRAVPGFIAAHEDDADAVVRSSVPVAGGTVDLTLSWVNYGRREL